MIEILPGIELDENELVYSASRSSGPGGQHVQKVSTRMTAALDVAHSPSFTDEQKTLIVRRLGKRVNREGLLQVTAQAARSQKENRDAARDRLVQLLALALARPKPRKPTRPTRGAQERRLVAKKRRGLLKRERRPEGRADD